MRCDLASRHRIFDDGSTSEMSDCEGRRKNDDDDGGGGGGMSCGRRKNVADGGFCWLLRVVKSFTDVHRWMNVDDDIFSSFSPLSLVRARASRFLSSRFVRAMFNREQQKLITPRR